MTISNNVSEKTTRIIINASILFVSVFTTLSLLFSVTSTQFKSVYFYLGYMLYFAFPFILACFFGIVFLIIKKDSRAMAKIIGQFQIAFFLTGLMMIIWLATSAAQTIILPTVYVFYMPYFSIPLLEFVVFAVFSMALLVSTAPNIKTTKPNIIWLNKLANKLRMNRMKNSTTRRLRSRKVISVRPRTKLLLTALSCSLLIFVFICGILFMSTFGYVPVTSDLKSGSVPLQFTYPLNVSLFQTVKVPLQEANEVSIKITANNLVGYYFLDRTIILFSHIR